MPLTLYGETKNYSQWARDYRCQCSAELIRYRAMKGWAHDLLLSAPKTTNPYRKKRRTVYVFQKGGTIVIATIKELVGIFDLSHQNVYSIVLGKLPRTKGWRCVGELEEVYPFGVPTKYRDL